MTLGPKVAELGWNSLRKVEVLSISRPTPAFSGTGITLAEADARYAMIGTSFTTAQSDARYVLKAGDTMTGPLSSTALTASTGDVTATAGGFKTGTTTRISSAGAATFTTLTVSSGTSGRIPYFSTGGAVVDSNKLRFDGADLSVGDGTARAVVWINGLSTQSASTRYTIDGIERLRCSVDGATGNVIWSTFTAAGAFIDTPLSWTSASGGTLQLGGSTSRLVQISPDAKIGYSTSLAFRKSGDSTAIHFQTGNTGTNAFLPDTTTTANNPTLGTAGYRWKEIYGGFVDSSGGFNASGGGYQTGFTTRISSAGAATFTTLSTSGLATLASALITSTAGTGSRLTQSDASGNQSASIPVPTAFAQSILDDASAAAVRSTIGVGDGSLGSITQVQDALVTPPGSPVVGIPYLLGSGPTGAWSGHSFELATWSGSAWSFAARSMYSLCMTAAGTLCNVVDGGGVQILYDPAQSQVASSVVANLTANLPVYADANKMLATESASAFRTRIGAATGTNIAGRIWRTHVTQKSSYTEVRYNPIAEGGGVFIQVVGDTAASTLARRSADGITWTEFALPTAGTWKGLTWCPGSSLFVLVGYAGGGAGLVLTSPTGVTWTSRTTTATYLSSVASNAASIVVAASNSGSNCAKSTDGGITWTNFASPGTDAYPSISFVNGLWVMCGANFGAKSADAITWASAATPAFLAFGNCTNRFAYFNGRYWMTEWNNLYTSIDGMTWSLASALTGFTVDATITHWYSIASSANALIFHCEVSGSAVVIVSVDGYWFEKTKDYGNDIGNVFAARGAFYCFGYRFSANFTGIAQS